MKRERTAEQTLIAQPIKSVSSGTKPCCKYCHVSQEQYNLCKDCMDFFCDFCLALYHPKGHTVCKDISFSQFACAKHKIVYRYFCDQCKKMRCDECLVLEKLCSEHASSLHKLEEHMALEQVSNSVFFGNSVIDFTIDHMELKKVMSNGSFGIFLSFIMLSNFVITDVFCVCVADCLSCVGLKL